MVRAIPEHRPHLVQADGRLGSHARAGPRPHGVPVDDLEPQRRARIAAGSGTQVSDVNDVLKQYNMMKKMTKGSNQKKLMKQMKQLNSMGGMKWHQ